MIFISEQCVQNFPKFLVFIFFGFIFIPNINAGNFAYIVVESKSGKILYSHKADELRPPASLTKKMTFYLIFEALRAGKITLDTKFQVSARAASQEPCILGLKAGQSISVRNIIYAMVTRSANDASVVIAEGLAGSVEKFVGLMNQKAKSMGMRHTRFYNTSGLPIYKAPGVLDRTQITTARDMMVLARALYKDFPKEYSYFKMKQFYYKGKSIRNHNKMLNSFRGLDGIKTGYTNASRFNISVSAQRLGPDGKPIRLFAVVLGGKTSFSRDKKAAELMETAFRKLRAKQNLVTEEEEVHDSMDKILFENDDQDNTENFSDNAHQLTKTSTQKEKSQTGIHTNRTLELIDPANKTPVNSKNLNVSHTLPDGWEKGKTAIKA